MTSPQLEYRVGVEEEEIREEDRGREKVATRV
jgi:hypothetical protein